ncbi:MAG TPA: DUF5801 repeats-in-toxin domain-containing protein, partial [Gemmataceae bacterium]|nr:DUF5801 repeats-in-toxin domain-containing protein [Gemmataceae bacterium]
MWYHSLRRTLSSVAGPARTADRKRRGRKLRLDPLEDRAVPANLIELTGVSITHDESAGLQVGGASVPGEDNDDSDVALSNLATMPFSSRLFGAPAGGLGLDPAAAIGVARSAGNVITLDGSQGIFDVALTDAAGDPLAGTAAGLTTTAGNGIFLYTDAENNIALGREGTGAVANPTGAVVFAVVLAETTTGGVLSGAELWVVQFQSIKNPDATNPDDPVDLNDKLYVKASAELLFDDFSNAPSGQNDWLGFGPTGSNANVQILTTGKTPLEANNNQDGDTVNTSTIGLGTNSQSVTPGEGIRIDFVSGLNLAGDTKDMFGIDYDAHVDVAGASYKIVQVQGNPSNRVDTLATISNTDDEEGADFVDPGLTNDAAVNVGLVQVLNAAGAVVESRNLSGTIVDDPNITITITGNTALVTGLLVNYSVVVRSANDAPFNRILVENAGTHNFDLGTFTLVDARKQVAEVGDQVRFEDGGPTLNVAAGEVPALTVDETNLAADASGAFAAKFTAEFGADGAGAAPVVYSLGTPGGASGLTDTATGLAVVLSVTPGGVVEGRAGAGGPLVFAVTVDAGGNVTLDQVRA